jgi:hypothetical protein
MAKIKIFISSVQKDFASEREALNEYILSDSLLGRFFDPFLFELLPATNEQPKAVYLKEVEQSAIYLGLLGTEYGFEDKGVSVTERDAQTIFYSLTAAYKKMLNPFFEILDKNKMLKTI